MEIERSRQTVINASKVVGVEDKRKFRLLRNK